MAQLYSAEFLYALRNRIEMIPFIKEVLALETKVQEGRFRFICPICGEYDTAVNPTTNLARCFTCQRNFNTIDIVMLVKHYDFRQAVQYLAPIYKCIRTSMNNSSKI